MRIIGTFMNYELMICGSALEKERGKRSVIDLLPHIHEIKLKLKSLKKKWGGGGNIFCRVGVHQPELLPTALTSVLYYRYLPF